VATGLLGSKPTVPLVHRMSGKTAHAKTKQSSRGRWAGHYGLNSRAAAGASASHGQVFVAAMGDTSRHWGSQVSWSVQRVWTEPADWNPRLAVGGDSLGVGRGPSADAETAAPCSPITADDLW
jgi:hypothetical protein